MPPMPLMQPTNESPENVPISEVMTRHPICASQDDGVEKVVMLLLEHNVSGVPVIDGGRHPVGMISKTDILREEHGPAARGTGITRLRVRDVMRPLAFTVEEGTPISQAAALMAFEHVHRLPVVDASGAITGLVSTIDVLRWIAEREGYLLPRRAPHDTSTI